MFCRGEGTTRGPCGRCPITGEPFVDPVVASDGYTYERAAIQERFDRGQNTSPVTDLPFPNRQLVSNIVMRPSTVVQGVPATQVDDGNNAPRRVPEILAAASAIFEVFGQDSEPARRAATAETISEVFDALSASAPITASQADLLVGAVFLPLAHLATTPVEMSAMFNAVSRIVSPDVESGLQDVFATPTVRDGLFVSPQHRTSGDSTEQLFRAMHNITRGDDDGAVRRRSVFATPEVRDSVFLMARAAAAIGHDTAAWMFRALDTLVQGNDEDAPRRRNVFATSAVRDEIFVPFAQHALYADEVGAAPDNLFRAMSSIVAGDDSDSGTRRDLFATPGMRNAVFMPFAEQSANGASPIGGLVHAVEGITRGADSHAAARRNLFAAPIVRDRLFLPLAARAAVDPVASESLLRAIANITDGTDAAAGNRRDVFATEAVRDNIFGVLARRTNATPRLCVEALEAITRGTDPAAYQRRAVMSHGSSEQSELAVPSVSSGRGSFSSYDEHLIKWGFSDLLVAGPDSESGTSASARHYAYLWEITEREGRNPQWEESPALRALQDVPAAEPEAEAEAAVERRHLRVTLHNGGSDSRGRTVESIEPALSLTAPVSKTELPNDTQPFWNVERDFNAAINGHNDDYVKSRIARGLPPLTFALVRATAVSNPVLEARFQAMKSQMKKRGYSGMELREHWSFHGTHPRNIDGILTASLLPSGHPLNLCQVCPDDGWFGDTTAGVYVGRYVDYVLKYSNQGAPLEPDEEVDVIMFKTLPGKSKHIETISRALQPTPGFDSHSSPKYLEWYLFESAQLCPTHVLRVRAVENTRTQPDDGMLL